MARKSRKTLRRLARWVFIFIAIFAGVSALVVLVYRFAPPPGTPLMVIRLFDDQSLAGGITKKWRSRDQISPEVFRAVIAAEDAKFCDHYGFDWSASQEALRRWRANNRGERLIGASTISMQTAKNIFLWPGRSLLRKGLEAWFTFFIEGLWSKERILEVYVNVVEWGDGIYGVEAAAQHYFKRSAHDLSAGQAAQLAAVLPNPRIYTANEPGGYAAHRARVILRRMRAIKLSADGGCP